MLRQPQHKYPAFVPLALPDRQWPNQITRTPPVWLSTDLRDGNQALIEPMSAARKRQLFAPGGDWLQKKSRAFPSARKPILILSAS